MRRDSHWIDIIKDLVLCDSLDKIEIKNGMVVSAIDYSLAATLMAYASRYFFWHDEEQTLRKMLPTAAKQESSEVTFGIETPIVVISEKQSYLVLKESCYEVILNSGESIRCVGTFFEMTDLKNAGVIQSFNSLTRRGKKKGDSNETRRI